MRINNTRSTSSSIYVSSIHASQHMPKEEKEDQEKSKRNKNRLIYDALDQLHQETKSHYLGKSVSPFIEQEYYEFHKGKGPDKKTHLEKNNEDSDPKKKSERQETLSFSYFSLPGQKGERWTISDMNYRSFPGVSSERNEDERFSYFTLFEAIILSHILYKRLKEGTYHIFLEPLTVDKDKRLYELELSFSLEKEIVMHYHLSYDFNRFQFSIKDILKDENVGNISFKLEDGCQSVLHAKGFFEDLNLDIYPIWKEDGSRKLHVQHLKIGDRQLDLVTTSKSHRKGQWSFKAQEDPFLYDVMVESFRGKKNQVYTQKRSQLGKSKLLTNLFFMDNIFPEPFSAAIDLTVRY